MLVPIEAMLLVMVPGALVVKWPSGRITFAYNCETSSWFMCAGALAAVQGCGATNSVLWVLGTAFYLLFRSIDWYLRWRATSLTFWPAERYAIAVVTNGSTESTGHIGVAQLKCQVNQIYGLRLSDMCTLGIKSKTDSGVCLITLRLNNVSLLSMAFYIHLDISFFCIYFFYSSKLLFCRQRKMVSLQLRQV